MNTLESIRLALFAVRENKLRAGLTLLSISIGIFTIISIGTLVGSLDKTVSSEISNMGGNTVTFQRMPAIQMSGQSWKKYQKRKPLTYSQAMDLKDAMQSTHLVSITNQSGGHILKYKNIETDPNVAVTGINEHYLSVGKFDITAGRNIVKTDIDYNKKVCIIGNDVKIDLFSNENPIGKTIRVNNIKYEVIGVTKPKGSALGMSLDNYVLIPVTDFLKFFSNYWNSSLTITIEAPNTEVLPYVTDEAIMHLRSIRNCKPGEANSFEVIESDALEEQFADLTAYLSIFGLIIGGISLLAAGVGIMNIMLVSVKERTKEIGVRKAVGAKRSAIMMQFIIEAVTLCEVGGLCGVILGSIFAAIIGSIANMSLTLPINWILMSLLFCTLMGVFFGAYPAWKAAKLDPIDALRYE